MLQLDKQRVKEMVKQLALAVRSVRSYPPRHPRVVKDFQRAQELVEDIMGPIPLSMVFFENTIIVENVKIDAGDLPAAEVILKTAKRLGIESITFQPKFSSEEFQTFWAEIFTASPLSVKEAGGPEEFLKSKGVHSIKVNEVQYGIIREEDRVMEEIELEWEEFIHTLQEDPERALKVAKGAPGAVIRAMLEAGDPMLSIEERIFSAVEQVSRLLLGSYSEEEKAKYAKWLVDFVSAIKPNVRKQTGEAKDFERKMAEVLRAKLSSLSDDELISIFRDRGIEDIEDLLPPDKRLSLQELKEQVAAKGLATAEEVRFEVKEGADKIVVTDEESFASLEEKVTKGISAGEVDELLRPFMGMLEDSNPAVRKKGVESLGEAIDGLVAKAKVEAIERLIEDLGGMMEKEEDFDVYLAYTKVLEQIGRRMREIGREDVSEKVQEAFGKQLESEAKRKKAVEALGKIGGKDAMITLLNALWESGIYREIRSAIVNIGEEAIPLVVEIFQEAEDATLRRRLADVLVHIGARAIPYLKEIVEDPRWHVRRDLAVVVGQIGGEEALEILSKLLRDKEREVRKSALQALGEMGSREAIRVLIEWADEKKDFVLFPELFRHLVKVGGDEVVAFFSRLMEKEAEREGLMKEVFRTASSLKDPGLLPSFRRFLEEKTFIGAKKFADDVRVAAANAIARIGGDEARSILEQAMAKEKGNVKASIEMALRRMDAKRENLDT